MFPRPRSPRALHWVTAGVSLVLVVATGIYLVLARPGDVTNPDVEFTPEEPEAPKQPPSRFDWPVYGFTKSRTSHLPLARPFRPPFAVRWAIRGSTLLEFTPTLGSHSLFLLKNNGALYGVTRKTGKKRWKRKLGYLAASAPAYSRGTVYTTILLRYRGAKGGRVVAVSAKDGRTRWSRTLGSRSESSPLVHRGTLYFGTENGNVFALRARDGKLRWRYRAEGAVKAGLAMDDEGRLFFGDYSGHMQALRARDGKLLWRKGTGGTALGLGSGNFYATPAVAFGRVYAGNTDGAVYSFAADDGALAWRQSTGSYVYSSAAVANIGGKPTVYVGSYDGTLYALDARTGDVRWRHKAEGKISGGTVVLGDLVFYSTLNKHTTALGASTGRKVWTIARGAFNPVVSDGRGIVLNGMTNLYGIDGRPPRRRAKRKGEVSRAHRAKLHGHRHSGRGAPPRCHRHGHRRPVRYRHTHCHRHLRGHRRGRR
jgi:outer membrane protein assembly factor BamB